MLRVLENKNNLISRDNVNKIFEHYGFVRLSKKMSELETIETNEREI